MTVVSAKEVGLVVHQHQMYSGHPSHRFILADDLQGRAHGLWVVLTDTGHQGVGIIEMDHQGAKDRGILQLIFRIAQGQTLPLSELEERLDVLLATWRRDRIDDGDIVQ